MCAHPLPHLPAWSRGIRFALLGLTLALLALPTSALAQKKVCIN